MSEEIIKKITLNFSNIEFEDKYRQEYFDKSIVPFRISFLIVIVLYALFGLFDYEASGDNFKTFYIIRYLIVIPFFCIVFALSFTAFFKKHWQVLISISAIVGGVGIILMLLMNPSNMYYYGGLFLIIMANYFLVKLRFIAAVISGLLLVLFYNLSVFVFSELRLVLDLNLLQANAFYISANLICMFALYNIERLSRIEFSNHYTLLAKQNEIHGINQNLAAQVHERTELLDERNKKLVREIRRNKKIEKQLIISKDKAEESERLKTAFLANMSHEIRTPMNGILGFTELLGDPDLTGEEQQEYIRIIQKSGDRMLNTVNDIIEISKIETNQTIVVLTNVDILKKAQDLINFFRPEIIAKGMSFVNELNISSKYANVDIDVKMFDSILTNLIKNAIKYSDSGTITVGGYRENSHLCFFVKDTGIGIAKNELSAVFDRFVQANIPDRQTVQGSGLGLSISKAYIELLKGKIWLESELGKGSTFYFTIPLKR